MALARSFERLRAFCVDTTMNLLKPGIRPSFKPDSQAALVVVLLAFLLSCKQIYDSDLWWHLAAGRWIFENHSFIRTDPFSFTVFGFPWISMTWLYEVLVYFFYRLTGNYWVITLAHATMAAFAVFFSWCTFEVLLRRDANESETPYGRRVIGFCLFLVGELLCEYRWVQRPEIFSQAIGSFFIFLLARHWADENPGPSNLKRDICILGGLQVLWTNLHGLFLFGPILCGLFTLAALASPSPFLKPKVSSYLKLTVVTSVCCLLNPYGLQGATYPIYLLRVLTNPFFQRTISEAAAPLSGSVWSTDAWGLIFWVGLGVVGFFSQFYPKKDPGKLEGKSWAWPVLFLILSWCSFQARRNTALLILWTLPWVSYLVASASLSLKINFKVQGMRSLRIGIFGLLVIGIISNRIRGHSSPIRFGLEPASLSQATGVSDFLEKLKTQTGAEAGRFFANVEISNYLLFARSDFRTYIDSRFNELYPLAHFQRYMDILAHPFLIDEEAKRHQLSGVVLDHSPPLAKPLIGYLSSSKSWKLVYFDEKGIVFLRSGSPGEKLSPEEFSQLRHRADLRLSQGEVTCHLNGWCRSDRNRPRALLGELYLLLGKVSESNEQVEKMMREDSLDPRAWGLRCLTAYVRAERMATSGAEKAAGVIADVTDFAEVEAVCQTAIRLDSAAAGNHQTLGLLYLNTGKTALAVESFKNVIRRNEISFEGHWMLGRALALLGDRSRIGEMRVAYRRAEQLRPFSNEVSEEHAQIERQISERYRNK